MQADYFWSQVLCRLGIICPPMVHEEPITYVRVKSDIFKSIWVNVPSTLNLHIGCLTN